ncbi:unnamed protein product, partial [Symbiodinium microadriaticum]
MAALKIAEVDEKAQSLEKALEQEKALRAQLEGKLQALASQMMMSSSAAGGSPTATPVTTEMPSPTSPGSDDDEVPDMQPIPTVSVQATSPADLPLPEEATATPTKE